MTDHDDSLEEQLRDTYAHAGLTLYLAQCFEMSLENFLFLLHRLTNERVTVEELLAVEAANQKKTLGSLLKSVKSLCNFGDGSVDHLDKALKDRNYLAHRFFKDHGESLLSAAGRTAMIDALSQMQYTFQVADTLMEAVNRAMGKAAGVTEEIYERELKQLYDRAREA
jgi:hypothetical protein